MAKYDYFSKRNVTGFGKKVNAIFRKKFWQLVQKRYHHPVRVCEFGAGMGELGDLICSYNNDYTCYEEAEANVKILQRKFSVKAKRVPPFDDDDKTYDIVVSSHVLEHTNGPPEIMNLLKDIHRILKDGGYFLAAMPNFYDLGPLFYDADWTHGYPTSPLRITRLCQDTGFEYTDSFHLYMGIKGYIGRIMRLPFKILFWFFHALLPDPIRYSEKFIKAKLMLIDNYCVLYKKIA